MIYFHYQCSLPDPTPSASSLKFNFQFRILTPNIYIFFSGGGLGGLFGGKKPKGGGGGGGGSYGAPKPSYGGGNGGKGGGLFGGLPDFGQIIGRKFGIIKAVINPIVGFKKNLIEMKKGIFDKKMNFISGIGKGMKKMMGKMRNNFNFGKFLMFIFHKKKNFNKKYV